MSTEQNTLSHREQKRRSIWEAFEQGHISATERDHQLGRMAYRNKNSRAGDRSKLRDFCKGHLKGKFTIEEVWKRAEPYLQRWPELAEEIGKEFSLSLTAPIATPVPPAVTTPTGSWKRNTAPANAARRGQRVNDPGLRPHELRQLFRTMEAVLHKGTISLRGLAREMKVDAKTLKRWASGNHWPTADHVQKLALILDRQQRATGHTDIISRALSKAVAPATVTLRELPVGQIQEAMKQESARKRPRSRLLKRLQKHVDAKS